MHWSYENHTVNATPTETWQQHPVTDLRMGQRGPRATLSYDDLILTKNLRNCAETQPHTQFTWKRAEI